MDFKYYISLNRLSSIQEIFPGVTSEIYSFCEAPVNIFPLFQIFPLSFQWKTISIFIFLGS